MLKLNVILGSLVMMTGTSLWSQPANAETPAQTCEMFNKIAEAVMTARQSGVALSDLMSDFESITSDPYFSQMLIDAYDQPRFTTEEVQKRTIQEFANEHYSQCIKAVLSE